jgi:hypothetical protein
LLMKKPRPSPSEIAEAKRDFAGAKRDFAGAKRDFAEAALESFLVNNPRPSSSDAAATKDFDVKEGQLQRDVAEAKRDLAEAEWNLSKADLSFAQATQASEIELDQKRKAEAVWRGIFERFVIAPSLGKSDPLLLASPLHLASCLGQGFHTRDFTIIHIHVQSTK